MLTLVIPVYRNEESLLELLSTVEGLHRKLSGELETVFVVDGSPDRCYEILRTELRTREIRSQLILLTRNFGSFAAIRVGLAHGKGENFAVMAADLQEPPEMVLDMSRLLSSGSCDVVIGVRQARYDPILTRMASRIFWRLYRRYVVPEIPPGGVDVFGCNRPFRDSLLKLEEAHSSLIAQIFWLGFRREQVSYIRRERTHGKSAWSIGKKIEYLSDSIFAFTDLPIRLLVRVGAAGVCLAGGLGLFVTIARLGGAITLPGYAMTIIAITFFGALNLFSLGLVGAYAWRAYENTKQRPLANILRLDQFRATKGNA